VIPNLQELAERIGVNLVLVPLVVAGAFTAVVLLAKSISQWFDDRNP
jgi:hypothetical protein